MGYGLKISNVGVDVGTASPKDLAMHSDYTMFKLHSDGTQTGTIHAGQSIGTVTFTHNLGYIPAFWSYIIGTDSKQRLFSNLPEGIDFTTLASVYAGTSTITCIYDLGFNWNEINKTAPYDGYNDYDGNYNIGMIGQIGGNHKSTGFVFYPMAETSIFGGTVVGLPQGATIGTATLNYGVNSKGTNNADGTLRTFGGKTDYGTSISNLTAAETTAFTEQSVAGIGAGESFGIDVTSIVQEIVNQAPWASGTAMRFHLRDINFPTEKWYRDVSGAPNSNLRILLPGSTTFTFRMVIFKDKIF